MNFDAIPHEMRPYRQWICWRYEERDGKLTKIPCRVDRGNASVNDPASWTTFENACAAFAHDFDGIGFVFTDDDPFAGIDLDASDDPTVIAGQQKIYEKTQSYAELSPSGRGCHIIVKGKLPGPGRRKHSVEMYDNARFFTMTGDIIQGRLPAILPAQELIDTLYVELGGQKHETSHMDVAGPEIECDDELCNRIRATKHRERFDLLFAGAWGERCGLSPHLNYPSQSEADFAFGNIVGQFTSSPEQVRRIFLKSVLGQRNKAHKRDYQERLLKGAFDRHMPWEWVEAARESVQKILARSPPKKMNGHHSAPALLPQPLDAEVISVSDVPVENISWLWENWLARRKLHILAGDPEAGKTTLALSMAAILSKGGVWPDGTIAPTAKVLIWTGEDDLSDTIVPRLLKMGCNSDNIYVVKGLRDPLTGKLRAFRPSTDMEALAKTLAKFPFKFDLIIIDPLVAVQAGRGKANDNVDTREALTILTDFAQEQDAAIIGIHHNTKGSSGRKLVERIAGSLALGAVARTTFFACKNERHKDDPSEPPRIFGRSKSNIGAPVRAYGYEIGFGQVPKHSYANATYVTWLEPIEGDLQEVVNAAEERPQPAEKPHRADTLIEEARQWLAQNLGAFERPAKELFELAAAEGIKEANLRVASRELCDKRKDGLGGWMWAWKAPPKPKS